MIKLHVFPGSPRAQKVLAVAYQLDLPFEQVFVDLSKGAHKTPAFLQLNPNGRMPVLEDGGFVLWESDAIIQYLASKKPGALMPTDDKGRALVAQWLSWNMAASLFMRLDSPCHPGRDSSWFSLHFPTVSTVGYVVSSLQDFREYRISAALSCLIAVMPGRMPAAAL